MVNVPQDNMVFFAILLLVFVADPLAITLTIACNMVLIRYWENAPVRLTGSRTRSPFMFENFMSKVKTTVTEAFKHAETRRKKKRVVAKPKAKKVAKKK
jgi:hypothetical protein